MEGHNPGPTPQNQDGGGNIGPLIGIIIIIAVLVLGVFYYWGGELNETDTRTGSDILNEADPMLNDLQQQGASTEVADIEADLEATSLEGFDAELDDIESELQNL